MKNWIARIDALRPYAQRQAESGLRGTRSSARSATYAPQHPEPYDHRMSDRHRPTLSTR